MAQKVLLVMQDFNGRGAGAIDLNRTLDVSSYLTSLSSGMYVIRYEGVLERGLETNDIRVPLALALAPIDMDGQLELIAPEGQNQSALSAPGDFRILKVTGNIVLQISKYLPKRLAKNIQVKWNIQDLTKNGVDVSITNSPSLTNHSEAPLKSVSTLSFLNKNQDNSSRPAPMTILGHVQNIGDISVKPGEWLGHPFSQSRIESITLNWLNRPAKLDIRMACMAGGKMLQATSGEQLGTTQQNTPISELAFMLEGENAQNYELGGEVAFSDGTIVAIKNRERLFAQKGTYLVGLCLCVTKAQQKDARIAASSHKVSEQKPQNIASQNTNAVSNEQAYSVWTDTKKTRILKNS